MILAKSFSFFSGGSTPPRSVSVKSFGGELKFSKFKIRNFIARAFGRYSVSLRDRDVPRTLRSRRQFGNR